MRGEIHTYMMMVDFYEQNLLHSFCFSQKRGGGWGGGGGVQIYIINFLGPRTGYYCIDS